MLSFIFTRSWKYFIIAPSLLFFSVNVLSAQYPSHPNGCDIKGNISSKGSKIYHLPGSKTYARTKISKAGERWFCNESQAKQAGWRASRSRKRTKPVADHRDFAEPKVHPPGKLIKGNTSSSGKIYHVLGSDFYFETKMDEKEGDRWFSTEQEAKSAGWSKAGNLWRGKRIDTDLSDCQHPKSKHPKGCDIKGNISRSGKIYHVRGSRFYHETKIRIKKKERWFCTETQAIAAGWRRPKNFKRIVCPN